MKRAAAVTKAAFAQEEMLQKLVARLRAEADRELMLVRADMKSEDAARDRVIVAGVQMAVNFAFGLFQSRPGTVPGKKTT